MITSYEIKTGFTSWAIIYRAFLNTNNLKKIQKVFNLKCKLHESLLQSYQILVEKNYTTKQSAIYIVAGL